MYKLFSGDDFNQRYKDSRFVKLTNELENHNGYQFQTGLNVDTIPFNPEGDCRPGGIYFCSVDQLSRWLDYNGTPMYYVRTVTIPDDAKIWVEKHKFKADRLILGDRVEIGQLDVWLDAVYNLQASQFNGLVLQYIQNQTPEVCLAAVEEGGLAALWHVRNKDFNIYCAALRHVFDSSRVIIHAGLMIGMLKLMFG